MYNLTGLEEHIWSLSGRNYQWAKRIEENYMIQTLPLVLFIVLSELTIGAFGLLYALDVRNEVKRNFLVLYGIIYLFLAGLTLLFQQNFSPPGLLDTFPQLDKAWIPYETAPLVAFLLLLIPYNVFLWMDKKAGVALVKGQPIETSEGGAEEKQAAEGRSGSTMRILRLVSGGAAVLAGIITIGVMAMIYRPLGEAVFGGVFTVAEFFAAAIALGGIMTAMWLGHWYLVTPALTEKPLQFAVTVVLAAILAQGIFTFAAGPTTPAGNLAALPATTSTTAQPTATSAPVITSATPTPGTQVKPSNIPVVTPISVDAIGWLRILISFVMPLILSALAWKLIRDRSFQSATGMLYLVVVLALAGECIARGLFLMGLS
jgi:DMSO reductase anchor subunit